MKCLSAAQIFILIYFVNQHINSGSAEGVFNNAASSTKPNSLSLSLSPPAQQQQQNVFINTLQQNTRTSPSPFKEGQRSFSFLTSNQKNEKNNDGLFASIGNTCASSIDTGITASLSPRTLTPVNVASNSQAPSSQATVSLPDSLNFNSNNQVKPIRKPTTVNILSSNLQGNENPEIFATNNSQKPSCINIITSSLNNGFSTSSSPLSNPNILISNPEFNSNNAFLNPNLSSTSSASNKPISTLNGALNTPCASLNLDSRSNSFNFNTLSQNQQCNSISNAQLNPFITINRLNSPSLPNLNSQSGNNVMVNINSGISDKQSLNQCNPDISSKFNSRPIPKTTHIIWDTNTNSATSSPQNVGISLNTQCDQDAVNVNLKNAKLSQNNLPTPDYGQMSFKNPTVGLKLASPITSQSVNNNPSSVKTVQRQNDIVIPNTLNIFNTALTSAMNSNSNCNPQNNLQIPSSNNNFGQPFNSFVNTVFSSDLFPNNLNQDITQISTPGLSPLSPNVANSYLNMLSNSAPATTLNNFIVNGYNQPRVIPKVTLNQQSIPSSYVDISSIANTGCSNSFTSPTNYFNPNIIIPPLVPSAPIPSIKSTSIPSYSTPTITYLQTQKSSPISDSCSSIVSGLVESILSAFEPQHLLKSVVDYSSPAFYPQPSYVNTYDSSKIPVMIDYYDVPQTVGFIDYTLPYSELAYPLSCFETVPVISSDVPSDCSCTDIPSPVVLPTSRVGQSCSCHRSPMYPTSVIIDDDDDETTSNDLLKLLLFNEVLGYGCNGFNSLLAFLLASVV